LFNIKKIISIKISGIIKNPYICAKLFFEKFSIIDRMTKEQKRFVIIAAIMVVAAVCVSQALFLTALKAYDFPARTLSIVFVWLVSCSFHYWLMKTVVDKPKSFIMIFFLQTAVKLMLYVAFLAICTIVFFREYAVQFILHFFVVYLFFAIFEVSLIMKFIKENSGQMSGSVDKSNLFQ